MTVFQLNAALAGRYETEREIGAGGMATVYLARDLRHARHVALKVLNPELGAVLGAERFLSEIRVTANLQHPNLLPLFDSGEAGGLFFYVMPFVDGETLRARLDRERQLPVEEAVRITTAVASALDYAHRHGVIHRDLKPENILLHEGQPLVADFGIALAVSNAGGSRITQTGLSLGTPQYMSPEQATGDRVIDGRTDIYSLGAMLYEMLTGEPPHTGPTAQAVIARVLTEKARSVRAERSAVPEYVDDAVNRALAKVPADRWSTAQEFADALGPNGALQTAGTRRRPRSRSVVVTAALAALAAVVAGGLVAAALLHRRTAPASPGAARFLLAFAADQEPLAVSTIPTLALTPDGRTIIAVMSGRGGTHQIFVRALNDVRARGLDGTTGVSQPFVSPDGKWIGFFVGRQLKKIPIEGGTPVTLAEVSGNLIGGASWATADQIVFESNHRLAVISASGGTPRIFTQLDAAKGEIDQRWPCALADGNTILYAAWTGSLATSRIGVATLSDGKSEVLDLPGSAPLGVIEGNLVYVGLSGAVMAVPFDTRRRRVTGTPVTLTDRLALGPLGSANASLSRNGTLVYQTGSMLEQLVATDGKTERVLVSEPRRYAYPRLSPDGKRIAVSISDARRTDIWVYGIHDGTLTRLTTEGIVNERAEWTRDGTTIMYRSDRDGGSSLWERPADGSGLATRVFTPAKGVEVWEGELTPDGQTVVYRAGANTSGGVYYRRLSGDTASHAIAAPPFGGWNARLSPDGRWVAYASNESGRFQVYVRPFPGPGARFQVSVDGGAMPVWSRDSRHLFFVTDQQMNVAELSFAPALSVVRRTTLLEADFATLKPGHADYDVMPDGRSVLVMKPVTSDVQTTVVVNWVDELRAAMARGTVK